METPIITQEKSQDTSFIDAYNDTKAQHPDDIILFQMGDFFEMYGEDAKTAAAELNLNLTTRAIPGAGRVEMCGFPAHTLEQMTDAREKDTAAWLAQEYGGNQVLVIRAGSPEEMELPWAKVQRGIAKLIQEDRFFTEQEQDNMEHINPIALRENLAARGIVNGEVVDPAKLDSDPFIQQVERDGSRIAEAELATKQSAVDPADRFHVVGFDRGSQTLYAVWDDETNDYYVDAEGVTEEFTSEWQAEAYCQELQNKSVRLVAEETIQEVLTEAVSADRNLTDLQKKAAEIIRKYENLPMPDKISVVAQVFGCSFGHIETSPCTGKWRGTSDVSLHFDNGTSLFLGNTLTPKAKTSKEQNKMIHAALLRYNPEIIAVTKETAITALRKREEKDNATAAQKGLKPYTLLNVELADGQADGNHIGWYYVTLAVDGKIHAHLETGLNYDISAGKVSEVPTRENYYPAGALKEDDVDYVFNNVGFSSASGMYTLPMSETVLERARDALSRRKSSPKVQDLPSWNSSNGQFLQEVPNTNPNITKRRNDNMNFEDMKHISVYCHPATYAVEHGQLHEYRASHKANIACKETIEAAIRENYRDNQLSKDAAADVVSRFGADRVAYVLAATIQDKDWDGRFSQDNKAWAKSVLVQENKDEWGRNRNLDFVISQAHPGLIDLFTSQMRRLGQEQTKDRPSVVGQLQKKTPAQHSMKKKQQEPER